MNVGTSATKDIPAHVLISPRSPRERAASDRSSTVRGSDFFTISAVLIAALVLLSFPLTYFIPLATGSKHFPLLYHLHGLAFFGWAGLYVVQTQLVRTGKIRLHREVGIAGVALAGMMLPLGLWVAVTAAARRQAEGIALPFEFSLYNLIDILVFGIAFGWAIREAAPADRMAPAADVCRYDQPVRPRLFALDAEVTDSVSMAGHVPQSGGRRAADRTRAARLAPPRQCSSHHAGGDPNPDPRPLRGTVGCARRSLECGCPETVRL